MTPVRYFILCTTSALWYFFLKRTLNWSAAEWKAWVKSDWCEPKLNLCRHPSTRVHQNCFRYISDGTWMDMISLSYIYFIHAIQRLHKYWYGYTGILCPRTVVTHTCFEAKTVVSWRSPIFPVFIKLEVTPFQCINFTIRSVHITSLQPVCRDLTFFPHSLHKLTESKCVCYEIHYARAKPSNFSWLCAAAYWTGLWLLSITGGHLICQHLEDMPHHMRKDSFNMPFNGVKYTE